MVLEKNNTQNMERITKSAETTKGKIVEEVLKNTETGKIIEHKINGEKQQIKKVDKLDKPKPVVMNYEKGNGEFILIKLNQMMLNQLKEINYYLKVLAEKKGIDRKELLKEIYGDS